MAYVNVAEWNPEHVADWLRGLEDEIQPYTQFFVNNKINGCQLLTLARDDLNNLNMTKIGHQELVLEAVELLRQLHYNLTSETLQSLALKLGCKAQSLFNDLKRVVQDFADTGKKERVSVETLSCVSDIINLVKSLISWLDRYPFVGQESYSDVRKTILKLSVELASTAQRDQFAENPHKIIKETCLKLAAQSDKIVQDFNDSLIIQPASLEVAKIKRKVDDDVGIHINSLYTGVHIIEDIKFQSPAYRTGKVEEGDEIVQVNYQTVIGWQVKNIIIAMKEHPSEVHLTLKKRPRHPNVLGQVITLWPYRIPSKKTAFRKLYKWNKGKDRDLCPKSPSSRGESNSVSEMNGGLLSEKEKLFAVNKPRNRLRRRATVTGVSPTSLQAPVSLEELIGSNSRRKESVLRTISYDPNKTIDIEDNVFKREAQPEGSAEPQENKEALESEKDANSTKSAFLRPPQEKFMTGQLRRQEALRNSETVARAGVAKSVPQTTAQSSPPPKPPHRIPQNVAVDSSVTPQDAPSGSQSPKQKIAEWVNKQKKKPDGGLFQHALTFFSQDSSAQTCTSPGPKDGPESPKCTSGSPKQKRTSGNMFQFPFREGRPSLSELRGLKKTANSRVFSERVGSNQVDKPVTSPKQNHLQKRTQAQCKKPGVAVKPHREKPEPVINSETWESKENSKITDSYIHPKYINYAKIPQYPYEMHESKIVSLKKKGNNFVQSNLTQNAPQPPRNNLMHYQRARQIGKPPSQVASTLRNPKSYPAAFYSPSGRSLSFNNIAMSSDDSSSEEEYEIYEELPQELVSNTRQNGQILYPDMDPNFTRQVAEVYNMLSQRQNFLQSQRNNGYRGPIHATNAAIIDELALRMYHALRVNHMQSQRLAQEKQQNRQYHPKTDVPNSNQVPPKSDFSPVSGNLPEENMQKTHPPPKYRGPSEPHVSEKNFSDSVHEHPVDLPPSGYVPHRNVNPVFKSATSQEIHNLYTSQLSNKSVTSHHENEKLLDCIPESNEKDHTYETIPYQKSKCETTSNYKDKYEEKIFLYPAEKELERRIPCKDGQSLSDNQVPVVSNLRENIFCPIKEGFSLKNKPFEHLSAFKPVVSDKTISNGIGNQVEDITNFYNKNVQSAISSLMMNIPRPPKESYAGTTTKSSSSQTESLLCGSNDSFQTEISCLDNDESFMSPFNNCNSSVHEPNYCSSSSLNSSSSGSTISSAGSCYYYVETQIKPQFTVKFPSVTSENGEEAPLIDLRSPTLPTMGVSMLGKKRSTSSSGSEQGSNAGSRGSPCVPVITDIDALKSPRIVTDVEQTI